MGILFISERVLIWNRHSFRAYLYTGSYSFTGSLTYKIVLNFGFSIARPGKPIALALDSEFLLSAGETENSEILLLIASRSWWSQTPVHLMFHTFTSKKVSALNVHPNYVNGKDGQWGSSGNHSPWRPDSCPFSYFLERFLTCFLTSIHHSFFPNFSLYTGSSFSFIYRFRKKNKMFQ